MIGYVYKMKVYVGRGKNQVTGTIKFFMFDHKRGNICEINMAR